MVTSQKIIDIIKKIVGKHHNRLIIGMLGKGILNKSQLQELKDAGYDTSNTESLFSAIYYHNFINNPVDAHSPTSVGDMKNQQSVTGLIPQGEANDYSVDSINRNVKQLIDKMQIDVSARLEGIIRQNNDKFKFNALQNLDRSDMADILVKESSLGKVKQLLRDSSKDGNRDWQRVALTEMSNAIGIGSVDRIVTDNRDNDLDEVYVYRIIVGDSVTCKYCRRFYGDVGEAPKLYKLTTLLNNGSNYGLKTDSWKPVIGATHPNTRTSQIIELKPGFMLEPGGSVTYIGLEKWKDYIVDKLEE